MHLSIYLLLVGAAVLVTQLSVTDSYAIGSQKVEDHDSTETSADNEHIGAALNRTSSSEDSAEEDDSSEEEKANKVKRSAQQFSSRRNSDEFDNFSFEIDDRRPAVVGAAQPSAPAAANVRNPVFRNSDERIDASDELRSVLASRVRQLSVPTQTAFVNSDRLPLVPLSFRNLVRQRSDDDFDDDVSIEIRDRVAVAPVIQQRVVATSTVTAGRLLPAPTGLRNPIVVRQQSDDDFDDDVSLEIVGQVAPTSPVRQVLVPATQTGLPNRLPVPMGFRTQLFRESDGDLSLEVVRVTPNQPSSTVPSPNNNPAANNIRTAVFSQQSDERDDVSFEILGSLLNQNAGQLPLATPAAQTSAIRPIQQANNRQQPIQTVNRVNNVSARPVTARPQVQQPAPVTQVTPTRPAVASSNRLPLVPMSFRNAILVRQSDDFDDDISIEIRDRVAPATTSVVQQVVATQTATSADRLPVPMSFRNPNLVRQSDEFDDVSIEISDGFTGTQQVNRPAANGQTGTPINNANRPEFVATQDADGDVSLELVGRVQSQQPAGVENQSSVQQQGFSISPVRPLVPPRPVLADGSLVQTGNEGQRVNVFDDYSLEDNNNDDDDDDNDFFLEDQFDNVDGFRLLASDFFAQPPGNGFPVERSVENQRETAQKEMQVEDNLAEPVSLDDSDFHVVPSAESDDWFLVKQYMDHDYSSEELEGELAKEYFWQPVKDAKKKFKTDEDKMAELKPARS